MLREPTGWLSGVSLFAGTQSRVRFLPPEGSRGIRFVRCDLDSRPVIPVAPESISSIAAHPAFENQAPRCTTLAPKGDPDARVSLTEHVLAACVGLGVTDVIIEVDGCEPPILDGSSSGFTRLLLDAGIERGEMMTPTPVRERIVVEDRDASVVAEPVASGFSSYEYELSYPGHRVLGEMRASWSIEDSFEDSVSAARTFSLEAEAVAMRDAGLFPHLTEKDMLVIGDDGPLRNEFNSPDEPARHKLLDLIGDLALVGRPFAARITAKRSGHALNQRLAVAIAEHLDNES